MTKTQKWMVGITYLVIPFSYIVSPYITAVLIMIQSWMLVKHQKELGNRVLIIFLNAVLFSCFTVLELRLYDWVIIGSILIVLVKKKMKIVVPVSVMAMMLFFFFNTFIHPVDSDTLLELERYLMSLLLVVLVVNLDFDLNKAYNQMIMLALASFYNAVIVYLLIGIGKIQQLSSLIVSSNIFIYNQASNVNQVMMQSSETRMNGFFSDPNKYMVFCFAFLIICDLLLKDGTGNMLRAIIMMASVVSLSRTALMVLVAYIVLKHMYKMVKQSPSIFIVEVSVICVCLMVSLLIPNLISNFGNEIYDGTAKLLGRTKTLSINPSVGDDNRVIVWQLALESIKQSVIFGHGWMSYENLLPYPTHNTLIELMLDGGLVTTVPYLLFFMPMYKMKKWYLTLSCYLIPVMLLGLADYRLWFLILGIILNRRSTIDSEESLYLRPNYK